MPYLEEFWQEVAYIFQDSSILLLHFFSPLNVDCSLVISFTYAFHDHWYVIKEVQWHYFSLWLNSVRINSYNKSIITLLLYDMGDEQNK